MTHRYQGANEEWTIEGPRLLFAGFSAAGHDNDAASGSRRSTIEEHRLMFLERCQEAKSLGLAISRHKQATQG